MSATITALEAAMSDAIDRYEYAAMIFRETGDPFWDVMAAWRQYEAEKAIAAFEAAIDAESADERRDEALWQAEQQRVAAEQEADYRAHEAACTGTDGLF